MSHLTFNYEYSEPEGIESTNTWIKVGVSADTCDKRLSSLIKLEAKLRDTIPFGFATMSEPEVRILGGDRKKDIASVEMMISPARLSIENAIKYLIEAKFYRGFETALG